MAGAGESGERGLDAPYALANQFSCRWIVNEDGSIEGSDTR
jgi:hypothetical protein